MLSERVRREGSEEEWETASGDHVGLAKEQARSRGKHRELYP